ncbi:hypothetical protein GCM10022378_16080 [Salinicoccus jeotgali]|uniref:DUF3784 domain-containing protein n=1 Tax=Salinicoccus jeotgali TaxID=381634 RepID=A0ABP7EZ01_9STAP
MINILIVISMIIAGFGIGKYISFAKSEGTDERGQAVLAKASHVTMSFLFLTFALVVIIIVFLNASRELLGLIFIIALSLLIFINAVTISYISKNV